MRALAREAVFKTVFASRFTGEIDNSLKISLYKIEKLNDDDIKYADRVLEIISEKEDEFKQLIDKYSANFPESRLFPADKSILLVALAEILYMDDIPASVSANEAANIASKYSTTRSASFISGILSEIIRK